MFDFVSNDSEAILRLNELYHIVKSAEVNGFQPSFWVLAEMHFLTYILTGYHA